MKKGGWLLVIFSVMVLVACNNRQPETEKPKARIVLRFDIDTAGNITDKAVIQQLTDLAIKINRNADRVVMHSYTEKMNTVEDALALATRQAAAAKAIMFNAAKDRIYYSVGIDAKGFENPVDAANPGAIANRRIEFEYLK